MNWIQCFLRASFARWFNCSEKELKRRSLVWLAAALLSFFSPSHSLAQGGTDSKEARLNAAKEYLEAINFSDELSKPAMSFQPPPPPNTSPEVRKQLEERQAARQKEEEEVRKKIDFKLLEKTAREALADTFTVEELQGMTNFYRSPAGKAMRSKMKFYSEKYFPVLNAELNKYRTPPPSVPMSGPSANSLGGMYTPMNGVGPRPPMPQGVVKPEQPPAASR